MPMITLTRPAIIACRILLFLALLVTTYATTAELTHPAVTGVNDKFAHLATFFILSLLADLSFQKRGFDWKVWTPLVFYGLLIEVIQYHIPYRSFSLLDWVADTSGLLIYILAIHYPLVRKLSHR
ncbi:MAG: VanZ family protein [Candidatus Polarisedimenticolaceae bacterium]|nr:VanZ family protein [Candidatus Polarisedimenticolaceae bacterium]